MKKIIILNRKSAPSAKLHLIKKRNKNQPKKIYSTYA